MLASVGLITLAGSKQTLVSVRMLFLSPHGCELVNISSGPGLPGEPLNGCACACVCACVRVCV